MARLIYSLDWSQTLLGAVETWPQSLKTAVQMILGSRYPMFVWWGQPLTNFYNDAYIPVLGKRHPQALGQPASKVWAEIWDTLKPQTEAVLNQGQATWNQELLLIMERNGYPEETYFTFSYSPIANDGGEVGGVFCACTEDTQRVLSARRLATLRKLATETTTARTTEAACEISTIVLAHNAHDIPFALLYLLNDDRSQARLASTVRLPKGTPASPEIVELTSPELSHGWQLTSVMEAGMEVGDRRIIQDLEAQFGLLPGGAWSESPSQAVVLPLAQFGQTLGFLIVGVSPLRPFDDDCQGFFDLVAGQVTTAISHAQTYEEEHQRAEILAELDRAKTAFFSNVSHEFRTPLTLMMSPLAELSQTLDGRLQPDEREQLQLVQHNGLRLQKLVNTLLDFSRIEAERMQASYEPIDLAAYTIELASVFRSLIERAGMSLVIDCPPLPKPVYVDREKWEKIVLNLLSNAFKFTFTGCITVQLQAVNDSVELSVADTGVGVPEAELPRLFERFHRVNDTRSRTYEGSGIGLALVQELVKLHGGTIRVTSQVNCGTTFTIALPFGSAHLPDDGITATHSLTSTALGANPYIVEASRWLPEVEDVGLPILDLGLANAAPASNLVAVNQLSQSEIQSPKSKILLVDDNADMRGYIKRLLGQYWDVETVSDGLAALETIAQRPPDLVLSDVMMPGLDGFGLLRELRTNPSTREIPMILLSARAGEEARIEGLEAGANDYLTKPFSARELVARVEATLRLAQLQRDATQREQVLRLEAETAKHEAEAAYQHINQILECMTDAFVAFDRQWCYTYANPAALQLLQKSPEALIGKNVWEVFPSAVDGTGYRELHRVLEEQVSVSWEEVSESVQRWLEVRAYPSPEGVAVYFQDITERKQAEAALRESMAILNTINQATPTLIYVKDRQGRLLMANPATVRLINKPEINIIGKTEREFLNLDEAEQIIENDRRVMETGQVQVFEETLVLPEGKRTFLSTKSPYRDEQETIIGLIGISTDITDRKQVELEREHLLARARHYVNQLQGLTTAAMAINAALSVEQVLQVITEQAAAIIGTHQSVTGMAAGQNWIQAIIATHLSDKYARWQNYNTQPDGSGIYACVCHLNRPMRMTQAELEAHPRWRGFGQEAANHPPMRGWLAAPLVGRDGQNIGLIQLSDKYEGEFTEADEAILVQLAQMAAVSVENAQLYEAEQQARSTAEASREEAQAANRIKDEFLAVLSHELRSPLNPILGWSRLLQTSKLDEARTRQALTTIERNAKLQAELIEDLLDVSRILQGKLSLAVSPVNLATTIQAAIETVRLAAEAKSIQIEASLDPDVGLVSGDPTRLQQIVWNLLSNAVKFTPTDGRVTVQLEQVEMENENWRMKNEDNSQFFSYAQITVSDTGKGISPDFLPHVFDSFRQADSATTRKFGGLGLGLAIVRHLVELHGGTIQANSSGEGLGAAFTINIPLMPTQPAVNQKPQSPKTSLDLKNIQVLVVDDDPDTRDFVTFLLEQAGATVIAVASAGEAVAVLSRSQPDVLLSDIGMPEMDGYMLMQQVRALSPEQGGQVKAIALTAYARELDYQQAIAAGFQRHIAKPIEPQKLLQAISELRERSHD